ncbi:sugar kinase [Jeotgalibacillus proteolyticus]|uniref:2-dehydro-3-deoxygluconokinase n=1 Tax=Jeotgalibacillus proteolyticus TaxID=2082395 RepID=A0A2S5GC07_9BACL|nr:sugar kinase [Jeotgalibacillus proteolyticus]PPA70451.1 2-dehydro-3-deoxygluconokinase [Jeotgalibacillus proteolyticus]
MSKKIAAFGEVMMRLQVPGYELLSQANTLHYSFSGTGVNVVSAMTNYGHEGYLVSALPKNAVGDAAATYLKKLGIFQSYIVRRGNYLGQYFLETGFGIRQSRVTYSNRLESSFNTASEDTYNFSKIAKEVDIVHFCGITLAMNETTLSNTRRFAHAVKESGGLIVFDCNYRPSLWGEGGYKKAKPFYDELLGLSEIVLMNEKDAMYVLGLKTEKSSRMDQLTELIPLVAKKYSIPVIAGTHRTINENQTHSLQGYLYKNNKFTFSDTLTFSVYDRIGAGDAFTSGIIHGEAEGFTEQKTIDFAVTAGMLKHTTLGDTPVLSESDILRAISMKGGDIRR